jgi:hypothetical protein
VYGVSRCSPKIPAAGHLPPTSTAAGMCDQGLPDGGYYLLQPRQRRHLCRESSHPHECLTSCSRGTPAAAEVIIEKGSCYVRMGRCLLVVGMGIGKVGGDRHHRLCAFMVAEPSCDVSFPRAFRGVCACCFRIAAGAGALPPV